GGVRAQAYRPTLNSRRKRLTRFRQSQLRIVGEESNQFVEDDAVGFRAFVILRRPSRGGDIADRGDACREAFIDACADYFGAFRSSLGAARGENASRPIGERHAWLAEWSRAIA